MSKWYKSKKKQSDGLFEETCSDCGKTFVGIFVPTLDGKWHCSLCWRTDLGDGDEDGGVG